MFLLMRLFSLVFESTASPKLSSELPLHRPSSWSFYICWIIILVNEPSFDYNKYYTFSVNKFDTGQIWDWYFWSWRPSTSKRLQLLTLIFHLNLRKFRGTSLVVFQCKIKYISIGLFLLVLNPNNGSKLSKLHRINTLELLFMNE